MNPPSADETSTVRDAEQVGRAEDLVWRELWPRAKGKTLAGHAADSSDWVPVLEARLRLHLPRLLSLLLQLYGNRWDFLRHLEVLLGLLTRSALERPAALRDLDVRRERDSGWFQSETRLGGVLYVDAFAGNLAGLRQRISYLEELGIDYLHLMPLFDSPAGNSDGGYAVSSYRRVRPDLGTMEELSALAGELRERGISLVADFVFNHTSDEHDWARAARSGDGDALDYYHTFPDRTVPDQYERTLREIFPEVRRGSFTFDPELKRWVWTTFHSFQWDLNYANPALFNAMAGEMLFLANQGVEVLRLDAVAFIWKQMGTDCENRPEAHLLVQAFNAVARIAAPALLFKSEAIVHPDEVIRYIGLDRCQLSYNPLLMALCWEALATREVRLLDRALRTRHALPPGTAWVNYLRSHDDIGWTFDDADARAVGIDPEGHRRFLNNFYTGRFPGSFARGLPFQENPVTGDARVSGTLASLAGLEAALLEKDEAKIEIAMSRILLLYSVILTAGGIPLLYIGDELAQLNDYKFADDPAKEEDSRWVHRPPFPWNAAEGRNEAESPQARLFRELQRRIRLRAAEPALAGNALEPVTTGNPHVIGYVRRGLMEKERPETAPNRLLVLGNFSEREQRIPGDILRRYGTGYEFEDLLSGEVLRAEGSVSLRGYRSLWLAPRG